MKTHHQGTVYLAAGYALVKESDQPDLDAGDVWLLVRVKMKNLFEWLGLPWNPEVFSLMNEREMKRWKAKEPLGAHITVGPLTRKPHKRL